MTATKILKINGNFIVKLFEGYLSNEYVKIISEYFKTIDTVKPLASRKNSAEIYLVGKKFKGKKFQINPKSPIIDILKLKF